jgi:hypothetical protein
MLHTTIDGHFCGNSIRRLPLSFADQGKQTSVSISVSSKQTEIFCFRFLFAENKRKLPFPFTEFRKRLYNVFASKLIDISPTNSYVMFRNRNFIPVFKEKFSQVAQPEVSPRRDFEGRFVLLKFFVASSWFHIVGKEYNEDFFNSSILGCIIVSSSMFLRS